ncbi:riboflavin synthase [Pampinifervens florentissimum]|uniref:riboflavin synthase n=1 Tax=Pampinifervens florentissimum TaxID=1632019 RepID=UPI0013B47961|nr:riboflavin synthase [Hydrogenobacter sp. T-8]QID34132.1 riboflavin synthase [Hydrogenobacter sp. T-8]
MFTGLVERVGRVEALRGGRLVLDAGFEDVVVGESIAVNGVCLTVVKIDRNILEFDLSEETLSRSNLRFLKRGDYVNLERALRPSDRLGGHILQGHVDFTSPIVKLQRTGEHWSLIVEIKPGYEMYFVEKGSVGIDGISLTINKVERRFIYINVIPHTYQNTNLRFRKVGDMVNVEVDIIGKYVVNYLQRLKGGNLQNLLDNLL